MDAKSKFLGKSFEIRPTGVAHADLVLPEEWCPNYNKPAQRAGHVREHYSWKKVTTSVSNFIMGNPQIDHYGDMEITNHRTGEKCVLTFKPRGWRAGNACELKGNVYDAKGNVAWELAGRWNGQLGEYPNVLTQDLVIALTKPIVHYSRKTSWGFFCSSQP